MVQREWTFPLSFQGTIFDTETTGLDPSKNELITIGYFSQGQLRIYQRDNPSSVGSRELQEISKKLTVLPKPYFSYNKEFEEGWLGFKLDLDMMTKWRNLSEQVKIPHHMWCKEHKWVKPSSKSLCPQCGGLLYETIKWPSSAELISLPHAYFFQSDIEGKEVPKIWDRYVQTRKKKSPRANHVS